MENKKENVNNQDLSSIFTEDKIGNKSKNITDVECEVNVLVPKSIGGIELKNYEEGEYNGLEEYENE